MPEVQSQRSSKDAGVVPCNAVQHDETGGDGHMEDLMRVPHTSDICEVLGRDWLLLVGRFLDYMALARSQCAGPVCPRVVTHLWEESARQYLHSFPLWGKNAEKRAEELTLTLTGSRRFRELRLLQQSIFLPKAWEPWICKTSSQSLKAFGSGLEESSPFQMAANVSRQWECLPQQATLAVAAGAFRGQPFVTGIRMSSVGAVGDSVCVGIEASGDRESGLVMSVMFAPYEGQVYIKHAENGPLMQAQALPSLSDTPINAWMEVTDKGAVRFLRQADGRELEETGILPPEMFPKWVDCFFASIHFWCYDMAAKQLNASVEWCGSAFPSELSAPVDCTEMDVVWSLIEDDFDYS